MDSADRSQLGQDVSSEATRLLALVSHGDASAADELLPIVYQELRAIAGSYFRQQRANHTLQPTALVHEAYVKLIGASGIEWESGAHFRAVASKAMRQILANHAEAKRTLKRGGEAKHVPVHDVTAVDGQAFELVALDDALTDLSTLDERMSQIVQLRFFGGLEMTEVASVLGVSLSSTERGWRQARTWLKAHLAGSFA